MYSPPNNTPSPSYQGMNGGFASNTPAFGQRSPEGLARFKPTITYILMGIMVGMFLLQLLSQWLVGDDLVAYFGLKVNELILDGQFWRLITPMFLHGSILHLGFNLYALYIFGPGLERFYGHWRFLALFFLAGFAGNVFSFLFTDAPSLGSSTAIFGLLGAEGVFLYQNRRVLGSVSQRALMNLVVIGIINLVYGLSPGSGIDNWGHIGGLVGGALFAWFAGPELSVEGIYPYNALVDKRERGDVWRAAISVGLLFAFLVVVTVFLKLRY